MSTELTINTDGGSRGNPGPAACAAVIRQNGEIIEKLSKALGKTTNNNAEYEGVILALDFVNNNKVRFQEVEKIHFILDSELVVRQLTGVYKIKQPHIQILVNRVKTLGKESGKNIFFKHVLREQNKDADFLVNQTLDSQK